MATVPLTVRLDEETQAAVERVASELRRDRDWVVDAALDAYLEAYRRQADHIREGLRQAEEGEFATDAEVASAFARWRR